jgi:hypothetical protein
MAMQATASFQLTVFGIEEVTEHCEARVSHMVSILDPAWPVPFALDTYREHERLARRRPRQYRICGRGAPVRAHRNSRPALSDGRPRGALPEGSAAADIFFRPLLGSSEAEN